MRNAEKDKQLELKRMRNAEKDKQREFETKQKEFEIKHRESERKHELEVEQLKNEALKDKTKSNKSHEAMRLVPTFDKTRIKEFFVAFEKLDDKLQWEESLQTVLLQTKCIGKAQDAINALDADQCKSYDTMKKHILNAYELVPESYRAKFRSLTRINDETYVEFAQKKSKTFQRWLDSRNIDGDFDKLKNLVLVEEFKKQLPTEIRTHLNDLDIHDLKTCAVKADEFALSHKLFAHSNRTAQRQNHAGKWNGTPPHQSDANKSNNLSNVQCFSCKNFGHYKNTCPQLTKKANANSESVSPETDKKQNTCAKCKRRGHWTKDCWSDKLCTLCNNVGHIEEVCKSKPKSAGLVALASRPIENNNQNYVAEVTSRVHNVTVNPVNVKANEVFRPFISKGSITYDGKNYHVDILRDNGCALSLILKSAIPFIVDDDGNYTGQYEIVKGVGDILTSVPLINLTLKSEFVNDDVVVGVAENIPVSGITFLLGNDLAKEKVTS